MSNNITRTNQMFVNMLTPAITYRMPNRLPNFSIDSSDWFCNITTFKNGGDTTYQFNASPTYPQMCIVDVHRNTLIELLMVGDGSIDNNGGDGGAGGGQVIYYATYSLGAGVYEMRHGSPAGGNGGNITFLGLTANGGGPAYSYLGFAHGGTSGGGIYGGVGILNAGGGGGGYGPGRDAYKGGAVNYGGTGGAGFTCSITGTSLLYGGGMGGHGSIAGNAAHGGGNRVGGGGGSRGLPRWTGSVTIRF